MSSQPPRLARRATALLLSASFLVACQGGSASPPPFNSGIAVPQFGVASVDNTTPVAYTPLYVHAKGLRASLPVSATFTGASGFTETLSAIRIASDGTVVIPVPQPLDPKTGRSQSAHLSMTLTQGTQTSAAVDLDVQDIPQAADYGLSLGVITRTYLNYLTMALGQQLGGLRALQASAFNHTDTSSEQAHVARMMIAVIRARNDVDRVMTNNGLVIPVGTVNGTQVNFDRTTVSAMDRAIGMYLNTMGAIYQPPGAPSGSAMVRRGSSTTHGARSPSLDPSKVKAAVDWMSHINDVTGIGASYQQAQKAETTFDRIISWGQVAAGAVVVGSAIAVPAGAGSAIAIGAFAVGFGLGLTSFSVGVDLAHVVTDARPVIAAWQQGESPGHDAYVALGKDLLHTTADAFTGVTTIVGGGILFKGVPLLVDGALQGATLVTTLADMYAQHTPDQDQQTSLSALSPLVSGTLPPGEGFTDALGTFVVLNGQGPILSELPEIGVGQPQFASGMVDPSGNYDIVVPTGTAFDTGGQPFYAYDPVSGLIIANSNIDLSNATPGTPIHVPTMSGTCIDTDANAPDADDPDCD